VVQVTLGKEIFLFSKASRQVLVPSQFHFPCMSTDLARW